jgi:acyl-CoA thioesterase
MARSGDSGPGRGAARAVEPEPVAPSGVASSIAAAPLTRARPESMSTFSQMLSHPVATTPQGAVARTTVPHGWLQGKAAFGGLQGALGLRAMRAAVGDALALRALQMTFVSAVVEGEARAEAQVLRRGRAVTHAQCRLFAGDAVAAVLVGLFGASRESAARMPMPMPEDVAPVGRLQDAPFLPERMPGFLAHYRQRWAGGSLPYSRTPPQPSRLWAQLREAAPDDGSAASPMLAEPAIREASLVALADMPASPVLSVFDRRVPGASLTWLLEFFVDPRGFDPSGWVLMQTECRFAAEGYTSQTARLWDGTGRAIGTSHQTTAVFD